MQTTRNFLYLDEYKMYSISSQIFGGLTEHLTSYRGTTTEEEENQSGPFASGRVIANILRSESMTQERKYLHDYAYSLFEKALRDDSRVLDIGHRNIDRNIDLINDPGFVEVRAKAVFQDMNAIRSIIANFNNFGEALAYVSNLQDIEDAQQQIESSINATKDRNAKARLRERQKALADLKNIAKAQGLYYDPVALEKLSLILEYGFQDRFEVQMTVGDYIFSTILKTEHLREREQLLVSKYSRFPEKEFVIFGIVTQGPTTSLALDSSGTDDAEDDGEGDADGSEIHMKEAIMGLVDKLSQMEFALSGKLPNEVVIDPIALFLEV